MKLMPYRRQQLLMTFTTFTTTLVVAAVLMIVLATPSSYVAFLGQRLLMVAGALGFAGIALTIFLAITDRVQPH